MPNLLLSIAASVLLFGNNAFTLRSVLFTLETAAISDLFMNSTASVFALAPMPLFCIRAKRNEGQYMVEIATGRPASIAAFIAGKQSLCMLKLWKTSKREKSLLWSFIATQCPKF